MTDTMSDGKTGASTGFILDPNAQVLISVYSSGAIGRLAR